MKKIFSLILFFYLLTISISIKAKKKSLLTSTKKLKNLSIESADFESLCSNLQKGFVFNLNLDQPSNTDCSIDEVVYLENVLNPSKKIEASCNVYYGEDYIECETVESANEEGTYKIDIDSEYVNSLCGGILKDVNAKETVTYSKYYSNVDLDTENQKIDYNKNGPYSFYIDFLHLDKDSNTKIYYEDYENNDLIEITECSKGDDRITCYITPDTVPCDHSTCNYNIFVEDDCEFQQQSILLTITSPQTKEQDSNSQTTQQQQSEEQFLKVTSVDYNSLCSNLKRGFDFYLNLESAAIDSCDLDDQIQLENTEDSSIKVSADCYVNKGEDYITCETTETTDELGDYKISTVKNDIKLSCAKKDIYLEPFSLNDVVGYSQTYSNVDLETVNQTIDYGENGPYSFFINFLHLDSNSNTKIYYEDYENNDLIEITDCTKGDDRITCYITPDTVPCDYATCSYNIVVEDDCGIQQNSILLKIISNDEDDDSNTYSNQYNNYNNYNSNSNYDTYSNSDTDSNTDTNSNYYNNYYYDYPNSKNKRQTPNKANTQSYDDYDTDSALNIKINLSLILLVLSLLL